MKILGVMSGSSLDGIDFALCQFCNSENKLTWKILKAETIEYTDLWVQKLKKMPTITGRELALADFDLGYLFGTKAKQFLGDEEIDFISSHGHTVFHEPHNKMTCQIGNGSAIAAASGISTICDFRSMDIGLGGQGAPLAAKVDEDLFPEYEAMINLGGISNISFTKDNNTIAYDISPCNQLLNVLAMKAGQEYDKDGKIASQGIINNRLLDELLAFDYFKQNFPKSLDNNFIKHNFIPILEQSTLSIEDRMATSVELIAKTLADEFNKNISISSVTPKALFTGGGTRNKFLMERIKSLSKDISIVIPDELIIDFKEALLMAYLGYLRINEKTNVLSSVTGASKNTIGGAICIV